MGCETFSWLENGYHLHPVFQREIFTRKIGHTDLLFGIPPGFISRSARARLQVSVCSDYDLFHPG